MPSTATPIPSTGAVSSAAALRDDVVQPRPWLAVWTLCRREWVRFIRQGNRVFGALGQPIVFWVLLSALLNPSFQAGGAASAGQEHPGISYAQYFFPGTLVM